MWLIKLELPGLFCSLVLISLWFVLDSTTNMGIEVDGWMLTVWSNGPDEAVINSRGSNWLQIFQILCTTPESWILWHYDITEIIVLLSRCWEIKRNSMMLLIGQLSIHMGEQQSPLHFELKDRLFVFVLLTCNFIRLWTSVDFHKQKYFSCSKEL